MSGRRGIVESPYLLGCLRRCCYLTLAQNIALFAPIGYCQRLGVIDNEQGETHTVLTNDVSSPQLSVGVRVSCMGAAIHWHEHHYHYGNHHRDDNGYDGHYDWYEHHDHDGHHRHHHGHYAYEGNHHRNDNGYDGHHHKHLTKHPAT
jgi:hypothetical protein